MDHSFAAFIAICASMLMLTSVGLADSPPSIPETFTGNVTVNGEPAPDGTIVSAWIDGVEKAGQSITGGTYILEVSGSDGDTITFKIYDAEVGTVPWKLGDNPKDLLVLTPSEDSSDSAPPNARSTPTTTATAEDDDVQPGDPNSASPNKAGATVEELGRTSAEEQGDEESSRSIPGFAGLTGVFMLLIFGLGRNMK